MRALVVSARDQDVDVREQRRGSAHPLDLVPGVTAKDKDRQVRLRADPAQQGQQRMTLLHGSPTLTVRPSTPNPACAATTWPNTSSTVQTLPVVERVAFRVKAARAP